MSCTGIPTATLGCILTVKACYSSSEVVKNKIDAQGTSQAMSGNNASTEHLLTPKYVCQVNKIDPQVMGENNASRKQLLK